MPDLTPNPDLEPNAPPADGARSAEDAIHEAAFLEAKQWMQRGMGVLSDHDPARLEEAVGFFEQAIRLRSQLPLEAVPRYRWGLTAGWMNHADALRLLGRDQEALESYDTALRELQLLPLDLAPAYRWRLGLAWMNRALIHQTLGSPGDLREALASLEQAAGVLEAGATQHDYYAITLGCTLMNRAAVLLDLEPPAPRLAQAAAMEGLSHLRPYEMTQGVAAEAALKARHRFCQATALLLEGAGVDATEADTWIMNATDAVEEALPLAIHWQRQGQGYATFGEIALQMFRFGGLTYLAYQPQFLGEYMLDVLRPREGRTASPALHEAALELLATAGDVLRRRGLADMGMKRVDDLLALLEGLHAAAAQIREWRAGVSAP